MSSAADSLWPSGAEALEALNEVAIRKAVSGRMAPARYLTLREFVEEGWHVVEPATPFIPGWHLDAIVEHLEAVTRGEIRNLAITMPPRHAKSLCVAVFWPVWVWTFDPASRWLFASYALPLSTRDSVKCRRLIQSPWYQRHWGNRFRLTGDQNVKMRFENDRTGYRLATSVGGSATGEGGDYIVVDDPHNVKEAESVAKREGALEWWDQTMSTRLNDPKTGRRVIVQQRVHERDLVGHVLEQGGYEHLSLPAEYEPTSGVAPTSLGWQDPRTRMGELLWPDRFGPAEIAEAKLRLGSYAYAGQFQQRPSPAEGGIIKRHWWQFWQPEGADLPAVPVKMPSGTIEMRAAVARPPRADEVLQSWDMAFKGREDSDYVAGGVWARRGADAFLIEQVRGRMDFPATLAALRDVTRRHPAANAKLVEDAANGPAVIASLRHEVSGLIPVKPEGGKQARANAVSSLIEAGNVYLPHPALAPWVWDFIEECAAFPNGANDDQVDQMTQALNRLLVRHRSNSSGPRAPVSRSYVNI